VATEVRVVEQVERMLLELLVLLTLAVAVAVAVIALQLCEQVALVVQVTHELPIGHKEKQ
jgi:hypothetical protein